jgi:hypothetical protein
MAKAKLEAVLDLDNKPFIAGMNSAVALARRSSAGMAATFKSLGAGFGNAGAAIAPALGVAAVVAFGKSILDLGSNIQDTSERINFGVESVQGLTFAFGQGGASAQDFEKSAVKLTQSMEDALGGSEKAIRSFAELGITFMDLRSKTPEEILMMIADSMKDAENPTQALAAALDILGKSGLKLVPSLKAGADAINELAKSASKLSPEDIAKLEAFGQKMGNMWDTVRVKAAAAGLAMYEAAKMLPDLGLNFRGGLNFDDGKPITTPAGVIPPKITGAENINKALGAGAESKDPVKRQEARDMYWLSRKASNEHMEEVNAGLRGPDAQKAWDAEHQKNLAEAVAIIRESNFEAMDGEQKLQELMRQRGDILKDWQNANDQNKSGFLVDYAKKTAEIARQKRENASGKPAMAGAAKAGLSDERKKEIIDEAVAAARARFESLPRGLHSGSIGGYIKGGEQTNAHSLVRRGDSARKQNGEKSQMVKLLESVRDNVAAQLECWGGSGKR